MSENKVLEIMFGSKKDKVTINLWASLKGKYFLGIVLQMDNTEMDHTGIGCKLLNWIKFAQDMMEWSVCVNTVTNIRLP
jgi:hypothetical protein